MSDKDFLVFKDLHGFIQDELGTEQWIPIYVHIQEPHKSIRMLGALLPVSSIEESLESTDWEFLYSGGSPDQITYYKDGESETRYFRYGNDEGIEPLVLCRDFYGLRTSYRECAEEFRMYFNLYFDDRTDKYIHLDWDGNDIEVIRIGEEGIFANLRFIKHFLQVKNMCLALYFEVDRCSEQSLEEMDLSEYQEDYRSEGYHYYVDVGEKSKFSDDEGVLARLHGKKIILGKEHEELEYVERSDREYVEFIIDIDDEGNDILHTCNEDLLANNFGRNPEAAHYLTPVYFRKDVLKKYYDDTGKYSVEDQYLRCGGLWGLRMENHNDEHFVVYLGDLGGLYYQEQLYWRSFNIEPQGGLSKVVVKRDLLAQFTNPEKVDLLFKMRFKEFCDTWEEAYGWPLFKPLAESDKHALIALHVPPDDNQQQFDQQVSFLSKILIESINEAEIGKHINKEDGDKGITKLAKFLEAKNANAEEIDRAIHFLRNLHDASHGSRHRKGHDYKKGIEYFSSPKDSLDEAFRNMLMEAIELLSILQRNLM